MVTDPKNPRHKEEKSPANLAIKFLNPYRFPATAQLSAGFEQFS